MAETTELMKRPKIWDELTKKRAVEVVWPQVVTFLGSDYQESSRSFIEKQIMSVLSGTRDGYAMARELENHHGWAEERELVDLMDEASYALTNAHKELVAQWVTAYGITPERKIGDSVTTTLHGRKDQVGTIVKLYETEARYGVRYPGQPETSTYVVDYEDVKDVLAVSTQG